MDNILSTTVANPPPVPIIDSSFAPNQAPSQMGVSYIDNAQPPQYHQHLPYNLPQRIPNQDISQGIQIPVPQPHAADPQLAHQHFQNLPQDPQLQPHLLYQNNLPMHPDQAHISRVPMGNGAQIQFQPMAAGNIQIPQPGIGLDPNMHIPYGPQPTVRYRDWYVRN
ncbi:unnamed protein product [[Candida] boidinii]|nr:unnamed protein product [[Candida] boidinii]